MRMPLYTNAKRTAYIGKSHKIKTVLVRLCVAIGPNCVSLLVRRSLLLVSSKEYIVPRDALVSALPIAACPTRGANLSCRNATAYGTWRALSVATNHRNLERPMRPSAVDPPDKRSTWHAHRHQVVATATDHAGTQAMAQLPVAHRVVRRAYRGKSLPSWGHHFPRRRVIRFCSVRSSRSSVASLDGPGERHSPECLSSNPILLRKPPNSQVSSAQQM